MTPTTFDELCADYFYTLKQGKVYHFIRYTESKSEHLHIKTKPDTIISLGTFNYGVTRKLCPATNISFLHLPLLKFIQTLSMKVSCPVLHKASLHSKTAHNVIVRAFVRESF